MSNPSSVNTKQTRQHVTLLLIGTAACTLVFWNLLLAPALLRTRVLEQKIAASAVREQGNKKLLALEEEIGREYAETRESLQKRLSDQFPPADNSMAWIGERISRAASVAGIPDEYRAFNEVSIGRSQGSSGEEAELVEPYAVNVNLRCGYHQLGRFLDCLEKDVPLMRVKSLSVVPDKKSTDHRLQVQLSCWFPRVSEEAFPTEARPSAPVPVVALAKSTAKQR